MYVFRLSALLLGTYLLCAPLPAQCARKPHRSPSMPVTPALVASQGAGDASASAKDFGRWLDAVEQSGQVSGLAVAIVHKDQVLLQRGIGYADASRSLPVTTDTAFRLASLSKAFASALAAILVEDGMLSWDTHVAAVLPSFELKNVAPAKSLPCATSSVSASACRTTPTTVCSNRTSRIRSWSTSSRKCRFPARSATATPTRTSPFALIGDITYAVSGDFFYHQVEKRVFHPLGMQTATYGKDALESTASWARPHTRRGNAWVPFQIKESYYHVPPAAGVNASIKDMTQWLIAQMGNRPDVLSPAVIKTLHTAQIDTPTERRASPWRRSRLRDAGLCARLAHLRLRRRDAGIPRRRGARLPGSHLVLSEIPVRRRHDVELRVRLADGHDADAAGSLPGSAGRRLGRHRIDAALGQADGQRGRPVSR
jgi:beta-lactamase class C